METITIITISFFVGTLFGIIVGKYLFTPLKPREVIRGRFENKYINKKYCDKCGETGEDKDFFKVTIEFPYQMSSDDKRSSYNDVIKYYCDECMGKLGLTLRLEYGSRGGGQVGRRG